eukprot:evm.model.scf_24.8 EVM.evm.TU.scf_24.8   scf_24:192052-209492(+)
MKTMGGCLCRSGDGGDNDTSIFMFGGHSQTQDRCLRDLWKLNTRTEKWKLIEDDVDDLLVGFVADLPPAVFGHSLVFIRSGADCMNRGCLVVFGGQMNNARHRIDSVAPSPRFLSDVWLKSLETGEWRILKGAGETEFPARAMHASVMLTSGTNNPSVLVFGGNFEDNILADTLRLEFQTDNGTVQGVVWEGKAPAPVPLQWHTAVEHEGFVYVFGGVQNSSITGGQNYSNKLFRYSPTEDKWLEMASAQFGRAFHEAFVRGSQMIVFGGQMSQANIDRHFNKTTRRLESWVAMEIYDFSTDEWWTEEERMGLLNWTDSPPALKGAAGVMSSGKFYHLGGRTAVAFREEPDVTYVLEPETLVWRALEAVKPPARIEGTLVEVTYGKLILFGGRSIQFYLPLGQTGSQLPWKITFYFENIWSYEKGKDSKTLGRWSPIRVHSQTAGSRTGHALVAVNETYLLLYGGYSRRRSDSEWDLDNAVWALELQENNTASWQSLTEHRKNPDILQTAGRHGHTAVYLWHARDDGLREGVMVVFGGVVVKGGLEDPLQASDGSVVNELWAFNPANRTWAKLPSQRIEPMRRFRHSCVRSTLNTMVCYGGVDDRDALLTDVWLFELHGIVGNRVNGTWNQIHTSGPGPGARSFSSFTAVSGTAGMFVLFGGEILPQNSIEGSASIPRNRNDTWVLQVACGRGHWYEVFPQSRDEILPHIFHSAAFLEAGHLAVFGGVEWNETSKPNFPGSLPTSRNILWVLDWEQCLSNEGSFEGECPDAFRPNDKCVTSRHQASLMVEVAGMDAESMGELSDPAGMVPMIQDVEGAALRYESKQYFKENATWQLKGIQLRTENVSAVVSLEVGGVAVGKAAVDLQAGNDVLTTLTIEQPTTLTVIVKDESEQIDVIGADVTVFLVTLGEESDGSCANPWECGPVQSGDRGTATFKLHPITPQNPLTQQYVVVVRFGSVCTERVLDAIDFNAPSPVISISLPGVFASDAVPGDTGAGRSIQVSLLWGTSVEDSNASEGTRCGESQSAVKQTLKTDGSSVNVQLMKSGLASPLKQWSRQMRSDRVTILHLTNVPSGEYYVKVMQNPSNQVIVETQLEVISSENRNIHFKVPITFRDIQFRIQFNRFFGKGTVDVPEPAKSAKAMLYYGEWDDPNAKIPSQHLARDGIASLDGLATFQGLTMGIAYTAFFKYEDVSLNGGTQFTLSEDVPENTTVVNANQALFCSGNTELQMEVGETLPEGDLNNALYRPGTTCEWNISLSLRDETTLLIDVCEMGPKEEVQITEYPLGGTTVHHADNQQSCFQDKTLAIYTKRLHVSFLADNGPHVGHGFTITLAPKRVTIAAVGDEEGGGGGEGNGLVLGLVGLAVAVTTLSVGVTMLWCFVVKPARRRRYLHHARNSQRSDEPGQNQVIMAVLRRPTPGHVVNNLEELVYNPKSMGKNGATCTICITDFEKGDKLRKLPCGHLFHEVCITRWLSQAVDCPMCRKSLVPDSDSSRGAGSGDLSRGQESGELAGTRLIVLAGTDGVPINMEDVRNQLHVGPSSFENSDMVSATLWEGPMEQPPASHRSISRSGSSSMGSGGHRFLDAPNLQPRGPATVMVVRSDGRMIRMNSTNLDEVECLPREGLHAREQDARAGAVVPANAVFDGLPDRPSDHTSSRPGGQPSG